jgi:WD40 repeat protein
LPKVLRFLKNARVSAVRWIDSFWGFDVFIAHRRADAAQYAKALYDELAAEKINAFIDAVVYAPGDSLIVATRRHVAKSTLFVLLGSPELLSERKPTDWIASEIETYLASHTVDPKLILVDFGETVSAALASPTATASSAKPILEQVAPFLRISEEISALTRTPTERVLGAVRGKLDGRRRDRSRLRFFEGIAVALAILLLVAVGLGLFAWQQKSVAQQDAARARANEYATKARAVLDSNPREAALTAVEAVRQTTTDAPEPIAQEALLAAGARMRGIPMNGYGEFRDEIASADSVTVSDDGQRLAVGDNNGSVFLWNIADRRKPVRVRVIPPVRNTWRQFEGVSPASVGAVALSPDGTLLAIARTRDETRALEVVEANVAGDQSALPRTIYSATFDDISATPINNDLLLLGNNRSIIELMDLNRRSRNVRPRLFYRSKQPILAATMTVDGRLVASIDSSGKIVICRTDNARVVKSVTLSPLSSLPSAWDDSARFKKSFPVTSLRLSSDAHYVAVLAQLPSELVQPQQMAEVWDISRNMPAVVAKYPRTRSEFGNFDQGNGNLVTDIAFSPGSRRMALAHNGQLRLWDLSRGYLSGLPAKAVTLAAEYSTMAFSPDGEQLAVGDASGNVLTVELRELEDNPIEVLSAEDGAGTINSLIFAKDTGALLAAGSADSAWLLNSTGGIADPDFAQLSPPHLLGGESIHVDDGSRVAAALSSTGIWLTSLHDLTTRLVPMRNLSAQKAHLYLYPNGSSAVVSDVTKPRLYLVDLRSGIISAVIREIDYPGPVLTNLTFDSNGRWAVVSGQGRAVLLPLLSLGKSHKPVTLAGYSGGGLLFSPRSDWLLSGTTDAAAESRARPRLWHLSDSRITDYTLRGAPLGNLTSFAFAEDGKWLASSEGYKPVQGDSKLFVWPLSKELGPQSPFHISGHIMESGLEFSPDSRWMISFDNLPGATNAAGEYLPKKLRLWRIPQFEKPAWERSFQVQSIGASFSPDSSWLTVGSDGALTATLIDLESPSLSETAPINSGATLVGDWNFTFSSDGQWFTTQGYNAAVRLWRLDDRAHASLAEENLGGGGSHVVFSSDSSSLAVSDADSTRVYALSNALPLRRISLLAGGHPHYAQGDSRLVLESSNEIRFFELDPKSETVALAAAVGRNLTWAEWNALFPDRTYAKTFAGLPVDVSVVAAFLERAESATTGTDRKLSRESYEAATIWAIDSGDPVAANDVAWSGSTHGFAYIVLPAAELAVREDPANGNHRDTRGVTRCGLGNVQGALEDFQAYLDWAQRHDVQDATVAQRRGWIATLKKGRLPKGSCGAAPR